MAGKVCNKCLILKELSDFHISYGINRRPDCKICRNLTVKKYSMETSDKISKRKAEYYQNNKENKDLYNKNWAEKNKTKKKAYSRKCSAKRRAIKKSGSFSIFEKEMLDIYKNVPVGCEVDHIIPLCGRNVTGLHVPWNLQYLTISENRKKYNKVD